MSLYASRDGALYQSYDDFAGVQGFYENSDGSQPFDPYASYVQAPTSQILQQPQISVQQPQMVTRTSYGPGFYQSDTQPASNQRVESVMVPMTMSLPKRTASAPKPPAPQYSSQYEPVPYGPNLRGVGIKFGERIDSQSGGMHVYVKRVVPGSPASKGVSTPPGHRIRQGDSLLLIDGEDVYGLGLDVLRERIPGPAGSVVSLGFKNMAGDLFEVELVRSAYASGTEGIQEPQDYSHQQGETGVLRVPRSRAGGQQNQNAGSFVDNLYASVADGGYVQPSFVQLIPASNTLSNRNAVAARTMQVPIMSQNSVQIPVALDQASAMASQGQFFEGDSFFGMAPMQPSFQYQIASPMDYAGQSAGHYAQPFMFPPSQQYMVQQTKSPFTSQFSQAMPQSIPMMQMQPMGQMPLGQMQMQSMGQMQPIGQMQMQPMGQMQMQAMGQTSYGQMQGQFFQ